MSIALAYLYTSLIMCICRAIESYEPGGNDDVKAIFVTMGMFLLIFIGSFLIGLLIGCINAVMTKFTKIRDYPLLESSLLMLMSYLSYLVAEAAEMSGKYKVQSIDTLRQIDCIGKHLSRSCH